jgi:hypothetical protein
MRIHRSYIQVIGRKIQSVPQNGDGCFARVGGTGAALGGGARLCYRGGVRAARPDRRR